MSEPLVSILIPTYGRASIIEQTVRSAMDQTYRNLEILVSDDCSPDGTSEIVGRLAAQDPRVRCWTNPTNLGSLGNCMNLLAQSRGTYLKFLLDDDLLMPRHVEVLLAPMLADPDITLSFSKRTVIDAAGHEQPDTVMNRPLTEGATVLDGIELANVCLRSLINVVGEQTTVLYPRAAISPSTWLRFGGAHITHALADWSLWMNLMSRGRVFYTPEPHSAFRQHGGQVSQQAEVRLLSSLDNATMYERSRIYGMLADPQERQAALLKVIATVANTYTSMAGHDQAGQLVEVLERLVSHLREFHQMEQPPALPAFEDPPHPRDRYVLVAVAQDSASDLVTTLETIAQHTPEDVYRMVIVDDAASRDVREVLAQLGGDLVVVHQEQRAGTAAAFRLALDEVQQGEVPVLVRTGLALRPGWLPPLVNNMIEPDVGAVGAGLFDPDDPWQLIHGGYTAHAASAKRADVKLRDEHDWSLHDSADVAVTPPGVTVLRRRARVGFWAELEKQSAIDESAVGRLCSDTGLRSRVEPMSRATVTKELLDAHEGGLGARWESAVGG